jgi:hypothetical protein
MSKSPNQGRPKFTKQQMHYLYQQHDFENTLKKCDEVIETFRAEYLPGALKNHPDTVLIVEKKYRRNHRTLAVIITYGSEDGTSKDSIRMLLINGIKHEAEQLNS